MSHISALCVHINMHTTYTYAHVCMCVVHLYAYHVMSVCVCAIVSTYVSQCMLYQCVQTYTYKWMGAPQMESAPPPSRSPGNNPAGLSIWCLSSICGAPHRLLLGYPADRKSVV